MQKAISKSLVIYEADSNDIATIKVDNVALITKPIQQYTVREIPECTAESLHIISKLFLPLVVSSGADANNLVVDQAVVSLGVPVGQVAGLGGEGLLDAPLLQQEAAGVADDGPGDIRGNHDGIFSSANQNIVVTISFLMRSSDSLL